MDSVELAILNKLADCWNGFSELEIQHPDDARDFADAIHDCQRIIMGREAVRQHPYLFINGGNHGQGTKDIQA